MQETEDFVARRSPRAVMRHIPMMIVFLIIGLWLTGMLGGLSGHQGHISMASKGVGWLTVATFGGLTIAMVVKLSATGELLRINSSGVCWTPWSDQTIPWSQIEDISERRLGEGLHNLSGQRAIVLRLSGPTRFRNRGLFAVAALVNRMRLAGDLVILLAGSDRNVSEALAAIKHFRPSDGPSPTT